MVGPKLPDGPYRVLPCILHRPDVRACRGAIGQIMRVPGLPAKIEVHLIDRPGEPFPGTGEAAQGPAAAALGKCNPQRDRCADARPAPDKGQDQGRHRRMKMCRAIKRPKHRQESRALVLQLRKRCKPCAEAAAECVRSL